MPGGNYVKSVDKDIVNRTFGFENYTREDMLNTITLLKKGSNFKVDNPYLQGNYTQEQLTDISNTIKEHFSSNAINGREDAMPFVTCALLAKGYSIKDIVGKKVDKSAFDEIYNNVMDINNPEKKDKAMEWAYDSFAKGMHKAVSAFESKVDDISFKSADTWMNNSYHLLSSTIFIGSCNYFEYNKNAEFKKELLKASEKEGLMYDNEVFDIEKAYEKVGPMVSKLNGTRITHFLETLTSPQTEPFQVMHEVGAFYNLTNMAPKSLNDVYSANIDVEKNFVNPEVCDWFSDLDNKPGGKEFIYDCVKKGKFFSSISINSFDESKGSYTFNINAEVKELDAAYNEFSKNLETNIAKSDLSEAVKNDQKRNSVTFAEVEETKKLSDNYSKASGYLESIASNRFKAIYGLSVDYSGNKNPTQKDFERLKMINKVAFPIVQESLKRDNVSIRSLATDIPEDAFVYGDEKGKDEKPLSDMQKMEYDSMVHDLMALNMRRNSLDIKDDEKTEEAFKKDFEQFKKNYKGSEKPTNVELMDAFVNKQKEAITELSQSETYKKVYNTPEVPNTNKVIKDKFKDFMEQLEATSEKDENGMLKGNTELFTKMYESVKAVAEYKGNDKAMPKGEGLDALLGKAKENIDKYVKERDSFIKFTKKGRDRIDIAKNMQKVTDIFTEEYGKFSDGLLSEHQKNVKEAVCKAPEIKNLLSGKSIKMTQKEKTNEKSLSQKDPEKKSFSREGF